MATPIILSLASSIVTSDVLATAVKALTDRVKNAQDKYQVTQRPPDGVENVRHDVIAKISELRSRTALRAPDPALQQKIWCLLLEQTAEAYESTTERDLGIVNGNLGQITAVLDSAEQSLAYRRKARWIAVWVTLAALTGIAVFVYGAHRTNINGEQPIPILGIPSCVLLWSAIGSFAAILYRFTNAGDRELDDPLRFLFSRPLTGIIMGAITFLVIRAGLLTMGPANGTTTEKLGTNEVMWLVAFLAGFSDRFADGLLRSLVGRFGGDKTADLLALPLSMPGTTTGILDHLSDLLKRRKNEEPPPPSPAVPPATTPTALTVIDKNPSTIAPMAKNPQPS